jgi:hypothetical protein
MFMKPIRLFPAAEQVVGLTGFQQGYARSPKRKDPPRRAGWGLGEGF